MNAPRPFREDDAPGRIPESLIDAVLDGSVDDRTRREVNRALRHDATRARDVRETLEAIEAMRHPIACPDLTVDVLSALDRKHRFLPARARRAMRQTRLGLGLAALLALGTVAVAQRTIPRLASIGSPPTPISDVAQSIHADAGQAADCVRDGASLVRASVPLLQTSALKRSGSSGDLRLDMPGEQRGNGYRFQIDRVASENFFGNSGGSSGASSYQMSSYQIMAIDGGRFILIEKSGERSAGAIALPRWVTVRGSVAFGSTSYGWDGRRIDRADGLADPAVAGSSESSVRGGWVAEELP